MATGGGSGPGPDSTHARLQSARESRWLGQGYADITKLREFSARHERLSTKNQTRAARLNTRIEKLRHVSTVLREKAQRVLAQIPQYEQEMVQYERDIKAATDRTGGAVIGSDVTNLHYRIRKLQQKIVDKQHKSRTLEHKAAMKTQKAAELKIKADQYVERSHLEQQEADSFRKRADRLQLATEGDVQAHLSAAPPPGSTAPADPPHQA